MPESEPIDISYDVDYDDSIGFDSTPTPEPSYGSKPKPSDGSNFSNDVIYDSGKY